MFVRKNSTQVTNNLGSNGSVKCERLLSTQNQIIAFILKNSVLLKLKKHISNSKVITNKGMIAVNAKRYVCDVMAVMF